MAHKTVLCAAAATLTAIAIAVAGCSSATTDSGPTAEPDARASASAASSAQRAAPIDPCAGAAGACTYVGQADVDGDGVVDQIGVGVTADTAPVVRVSVGGRIDELIGTPLNSSVAYTDADDLYTGAFDLSRPRGSDIVLHTHPGGGNPDQFVVATWRNGNLSWLPGIPESTSDYREPSVWLLRSSHGKLNEVACKGDGVVGYETIYAPTAEGIPQPNGDTRDIQRYTFDGASWVKGQFENVADPDGWDMNWKAATEAFQCSDETIPAT